MNVVEVNTALDLFLIFIALVVVIAVGVEIVGLIREHRRAHIRKRLSARDAGVERRRTPRPPARPQ